MNRWMLIVHDIMKYNSHLNAEEEKKYTGMTEQEKIKAKSLSIFDESKRVFLPSSLPVYMNLPQKMQKLRIVKAFVQAMEK